MLYRIVAPNRILIVLSFGCRIAPYRKCYYYKCHAEGIIDYYTLWNLRLKKTPPHTNLASISLYAHSNLSTHFRTPCHNTSWFYSHLPMFSPAKFSFVQKTLDISLLSHFGFSMYPHQCVCMTESVSFKLPFQDSLSIFQQCILIQILFAMALQ